MMTATDPFKARYLPVETWPRLCQKQWHEAFAYTGLFDTPKPALSWRKATIRKTWTGFADAEEEFADKAVGMKIQPYRIETEAKKIQGTTFKSAAPFSSYAIQDGNLITGQQQNSGAASAEMVVKSLNK